MIDTDKYEGHDLAKGRVGSDYNIYDRKGNIIFDADDVGGNMATLNLLADAPLLLAEVKRLREALITVQQSLVWDEKDRAMDGDPITLEALVTQVEQVRSDITEMIE